MKWLIFLIPSVCFAAPGPVVALKCEVIVQVKQECRWIMTPQGPRQYCPPKPEFKTESKIGRATGSFVHQEGDRVWILTNSHIDNFAIESRKKCEFFNHDTQKWVEMKLYDRSDKDLILFTAKVSEPVQTFRVAKEEPALGEQVVVSSFKGGLDFSTVSTTVWKYLESPGKFGPSRRTAPNSYYLDTEIVGGESGGVVLNNAGLIVGIVNATEDKKVGKNYGLAVDQPSVYDFCRDLQNRKPYFSQPEIDLGKPETFPEVKEDSEVEIKDIRKIPEIPEIGVKQLVKRTLWEKALEWAATTAGVATISSTGVGGLALMIGMQLAKRRIRKRFAAPKVIVQKEEAPVDTRYVPVTDEVWREAILYAFKQTARESPGTTSTLKYLESQINQFVGGATPLVRNKQEQW